MNLIERSKALKKAIALLMASLMGLAMLAGCGGNAAEPSQTPAASTAEESPPSGNQLSEKEIRVARPYDITTLDAHEANDDGSYQILHYIFEGLVRCEGGEIVPGVAEAWEQSDDGLEYIFRLRRNAVWSDGTPLTAEDFRYSFIRMLDPEVAHYYANSGFLFKNGEKYFNGEASADEIGIEVIDSHTLKIIREEPSLETLYTLGSHAFYPLSQAAVEANGVSYGSEAGKILGNGAFTLTQWSHEDRIVLEKNENYWNKDAVNLAKITGIVGAIGETAVDMMLAGELEILETNNYEEVETLEGAGYMAESFTSGYQFVHMNGNGMTEESGRFMGNVNFRRALNYAVNREALVKSVLKGAAPATRISSPDDMGVSDTMHNEYPFEGWPASGDPDKAKECLDLALRELGAEIGEVPVLSMLCFESQNSMTILQAVQDMLLSTLGIKTEIDPQPIQQMIGKATGGEWDFWYGGNTVGSIDWMSLDSVAVGFDYTDPAAFRGYVNERYVELLKEASSTLDLKARKDNLFEMEKELADNPGSIIVGWNQTYVVHSSSLSGISMDTDSDYTYAVLS
jgi:oligopeptide transport system substrate-binding protein